MGTHYDGKPAGFNDKGKVFYSIFDPPENAQSNKRSLWIPLPSKFEVSTLGPVIFFSTLQKKSKALGYWITRHYFLFESYLAYGTSKSVLKIKKYISLEGLKVWLPRGEDSIEKESSNLMMAFFRCNKLFMLKAKNEALLNEWIEYLRKRVIMVNLSHFYTMINMLGKGSYGKVYLVEGKDDEKKYAAKVISKEQIITRLLGLETLFNEIKILKKLNHKNIIRLKEVFETPSSIYIILEYIEGEELKSRLQDKVYFSEQECFVIMKTLLESVTYLHERNIVHRDLKLENILVSTDTISGLKLIDFGLSVNLEETQIAKKGGTPGYMAPEVLNNEHQKTPVSTKEDMFALGCIFYRLLTGKKLFNGNTAKEIFEKNKECSINLAFSTVALKSKNVQDLLAKMLEKDPLKRIGAAQALEHPFFNPEETHSFIEFSESCEDIKIPSFSQYNFNVNFIKEVNISSSSRVFDANGSICMVSHIPYNNQKQYLNPPTPEKLSRLNLKMDFSQPMMGGIGSNYAGESSYGSVLNSFRSNIEESKAATLSCCASPQNSIDMKMKSLSPMSNKSFMNTLSKQVLSQDSSPIKLGTPSVNSKLGFSDYFSTYAGSKNLRSSNTDVGFRVGKLGSIGEAKDGDSSNSNIPSQQNV